MGGQSLEDRRTSPGRAVNSSTAAKLEGELERLKTLSGIGSDLKVIWTPSTNNPLSGEVLGDLIKVYDHNEEKALRTLRHEFLDFCISQAVEPYKIVTNSLIKLINLDAYKRKERIVEALGRLFEGEVRD